MVARSEDIPLQSVSTEQLAHDGHSSVFSFEDRNQQHAQPTPPYENGVENENENAHGDILPSYEQAATGLRTRSTPLRRNGMILIPTVIYCAMAIWSWVALCQLAREDETITDIRNKKAHTYRAARTVRFIVAVATFPMLSAICAAAASAFVQHQRQGDSLRLRQVMTLADRSWVNPFVYARMMLYDSGFKRYGSNFMYLATFIHLFAVITYPIQSLLISTRQVNVLPVDSFGYIDRNTEFYNVVLLGNMGLGPGDSQIAPAIVTVRNELRTAGVDGQQPQLWGSAKTLSNYAANSSWFSQFSNNFTTGWYPDQYVPRVNSSVELLNMTEFPSDCSTTSDWFYASYQFIQDVYNNASIEVCLPMNGSQTPWIANDTRQDFTEKLYVNISAPGMNPSEYNSAFIVVANTTAGLFRLPSRENQTAGPLITDSRCAGDCGILYDEPVYNWRRSSSLNTLRDHHTRRADRRQYINYFEPAFPGPLMTIAVALFGTGSYFDLQQTANYTKFQSEEGWKRFLDEQLPFTQLPLQSLGVDVSYGALSPILGWIAGIADVGNRADVASAFEMACFLATKALWDTASTSSSNTVRVDSTPTTELTLPSISQAGLIVGSTLLGLYLIPALCLALYAAASRRWTDTLDAFTMMRMGAAVGQKDLPLLVGKNMRKIRILDDCPGVIRDVSGPDDKIRQLGLGIEGGARLQPAKRYLAYPGNNANNVR